MRISENGSLVALSPKSHGQRRRELSVRSAIQRIQFCLSGLFSATAKTLSSFARLDSRGRLPPHKHFILYIYSTNESAMSAPWLLAMRVA
jgi:hypothetical protein